MAKIRIPGEELSHTIDLLQAIRDRIDRSASLESIGTEADVGDSQLRDAVTGFDSAWKGGQERVQENVDTFQQTVEGILKNFEDTDADLGAKLDAPAE